MEARFDRLLVHFDVDTVDFTDLPLSENAGRNEGLPFEAAMRALGTLLGSERLAAVTIAEFNPDHGEEDGSTADALADGLARAWAWDTNEPLSAPALVSRFVHAPALLLALFTQVPSTTSLITREPVEESFLKGPW
jgi:hypothetical protein